jgi:hypothetical protein
MNAHCVKAQELTCTMVEAAHEKRTKTPDNFLSR